MAVGFLVLLLLVFIAIGYLVLADRGFIPLLTQICGILGLVAGIVAAATFGRRNRRAKCTRCRCEFPFPRFATCPECGSDRFRFLEDVAIAA